MVLLNGDTLLEIAIQTRWRHCSLDFSTIIKNEYIEMTPLSLAYVGNGDNDDEDAIRFE